VRGEILLLKETLNTMVEQLRSFAAEVTRVAREVGTDGRLGGQAVVPGVGGTWKDLTDNVNLLAANLTTQVRNIAEVTTAVARGDLSRKITVDVKGEILELKNTINTMVDQLNAFAAEGTQPSCARGRHRRRARLGKGPGAGRVAGSWKDLTDSFDPIGGHPLRPRMRKQPRGGDGRSRAQGNLSRKITRRVKGQILELKTR
jgi:HAMP domain-containing protein